jgi:NitT/TauT family transport system permease protein
MKKRSLLLVNSLLVFSLLIMIWEGVILAFHVQPFMLPDPLAVATTTVHRLPDLAAALRITATEAITGLAASIVVGVSVALLFASSRWIRRLLFPYTVLLQTVPIMAITPLILMWVGGGFVAVSLIIFIFCLPSIIANTTQGLVSVDENFVALFLMHNASPWQILRKLRIPASLPYLFVGIRIASGVAVIGAIIGELFAGSTSIGGGGLGYGILYAETQLQTAYLFALVFTTTALGFAFFFASMFVEWLCLHNWHESATKSQLD